MVISLILPSLVQTLYLNSILNMEGENILFCNFGPWPNLAVYVSLLTFLYLRQITEKWDKPTLKKQIADQILKKQT